MKNKKTRIISLFLSVILALGVISFYPSSASVATADPAESAGITVDVGADSVTVKIGAVGTSGTADLIAMSANEYYAGDPLCGLSEENASEGIFICSYDCGSQKEFTFDRIMEDGKDALYFKYYLVQNGAILAGPVYADTVYSERNVAPFEAKTKKGLTWSTQASIDVMQDLGVSNTVLNINLGELIYKNEDENGNPVDASQFPHAVPFECNGETFYFDGGRVYGTDIELQEYAEAKINVSAVIVAFTNATASSYPDSLIYTKAPGVQTYAFNTSNSLGLKYWIAAIEFLAERYAGKNPEEALIDKFIIGNEVDYAYDWNMIIPQKDAEGKYQKASLDVFMEEYARTVRMANYAVKKYNSGAKVTLSVTHNWADSRCDAYTTPLTNKHKFYNSYAPKDMLDWMLDVDKQRGDFDWGISTHPYPLGTISAIPNVTDLRPDYDGSGKYANSGLKPVTGDWETSPWITCTNLELYQLYFDRDEAKYNGELREVGLTETCICSLDKTKCTPEEYELSMQQQAATMAMCYYRVANVPCITEIAYFQLTDQEAYKLGLMDLEGNKKLAYDVWKYVDSDKTFDITLQYLPSIDRRATSYKDVMELVESDFDWDAILNPQIEPGTGTGTEPGTEPGTQPGTAPVSSFDQNVVTHELDDEEKKEVEKIETPQEVKDQIEEKPETERVAGENRYETSVNTAEQLKEFFGTEKFPAIVIASGENFADALAGSYLAYLRKAPIILTSKKSSYYETIVQYVKDNLIMKQNAGNGIGVGVVYVLGGDSAVSPESIAHLVALATGEDGNLNTRGCLIRLYQFDGKDRYDTNLRIIKNAGLEGDDVLVATGRNYADSLSASAAKMPILLVKDALSEWQKEELGKLIEKYGRKKFHILGGEGAVSAQVEEDLKAFGEVDRIAGESRFETSVVIAERFFDNPESIMIAYSHNFPDGLSAGPLAAYMGAPLILARAKNTEAVRLYCEGKNFKNKIFIGGEAALPAEMIELIFGTK